ncbi:hypothetical protein [Bifidobacterium lemurum]|uniref:hypothetical protein n=1 Tax=Bifidobacterium lemurum TaxID=1603886 RepID=UPI001D02FC6E|nr:hypothetical protein [Bifidobacterium lemurum]
MHNAGNGFARIVAMAASVAMLVGFAPMAYANDATASASLSGYTDKSAMKSEGRAVVDAGELIVTDGSAPSGSGTTYYVDSEGGDDANDGTSENTAWQSLGKVNETVFQPGDRILLKAGSVWDAEGTEVAQLAYTWRSGEGDAGLNKAESAPTAMLAPQGSGTADAPIVLSSYGDGAAPELNGRGVVNDVIQLTNQQYWDISNIEVTNVTDGFDASTFEVVSDNGQVPGTENPKTGDLRGVHVSGENTASLKGFSIHNMFVHDVSGVTWSVSKSGIDRSKRTGGIMFEGTAGDETTATQLSEIDIYDNIIANTSFGNIVFKQYSGNWNRSKKTGVGWGDRIGAGRVSTDGSFKEDASWAPHTDITVHDNYMTNPTHSTAGIRCTSPPCRTPPSRTTSSTPPACPVWRCTTPTTSWCRTTTWARCSIAPARPTPTASTRTAPPPTSSSSTTTCTTPAKAFCYAASPWARPPWCDTTSSETSNATTSIRTAPTA